MAWFGSRKNPLMVRVRSQKDAKEVLELCNQRGWKVLIEIDPDQPEDLFELSSKVFPDPNQERKIGRNEPCPCGGGDKYKRCCLRFKRQTKGAFPQGAKRL
jgi:SWIM/SEC-C metal-binding protein